MKHDDIDIEALRTRLERMTHPKPDAISYTGMAYDMDCALTLAAVPAMLDELAALRDRVRAMAAALDTASAILGAIALGDRYGGGPTLDAIEDAQRCIREILAPLPEAPR